MSSHVDLGFAENCEPWQVESRLFPSKIGGKPAWLSLENLPNSEQLQCSNCQNICIFLCQIYAPFEDDPNNFHRTLFIFICRNSDCNVRNKNGNIKIFRSILQRENKFYSYDPPEEEKDSSFSLSNFLNLCKLCGCLSNNKCSKCHNVFYCSREHQVIDWKENHKKECPQNGISNSETNSDKLFKEFEIVIEPDEELDETNKTNEDEELEKYNKMVNEGKTGTMADLSDSELEMHTNPINEDKVFSNFQKRIKCNPEQILRYDRGGEPLWISKNFIVNEIPKCEYCGGERQFEMQIMPQLLTILKENELDWGILAIYTCKKSCMEGGNYGNEFVFKQDVSEDL